MFLVVGLGNPGEEYALTRHNAGFMVVNTLGRELGVTYWKSECGAITGKAIYHHEDLILAEPQSFMNLSGAPVVHLMREYGITADHLIVIHDELDIPKGTIRVKFGGGHAGHNGLRSIIDRIGTRDFYRIRIGIGRPPGRMQVTDYVLREPKGEERDDLEHAVALGADAVLSLIDDGLARTQERFN